MNTESLGLNEKEVRKWKKVDFETHSEVREIIERNMPAARFGRKYI